MTAASRRRLLLAYPRSWRDRYEDEVLCHLDDEYEAGPIPLTAAAGLTFGGVVERARRLYDVRDGERASDSTAGLRLVAWGWFLSVVGGIGFAKQAEHFTGHRFDASGVPMGHATATIAWMLVQWTAVVALALLAAIMLPAVLVAAARTATLARGAVHRAAVVAFVAAAAALGCVVGVAAWAHTLTAAARNGSDHAFGLAVLTMAGVVVVALALVTRAVTVALRAVRPTGHRVATGSAAWAVGSCLCAIAISVGAWWLAVAVDAPGFLGSTSPGTQPFDTSWPILLGCQVLLAAGAVAALVGAKRSFPARRVAVAAG